MTGTGSGVPQKPHDEQETLRDVCERLQKQVDKLLADDFLEKGAAGAAAENASSGDAVKQCSPREVMVRVQEQTRRSMSIIKEALSRYSLDALSLSYNGGKDCLVLLVLFLASLPSAYRSQSSADLTNSASATLNSSDAHSSAAPFPNELSSIYIVPPHPFPTVESFVTRSSASYHLSLSRLTDASLKAAFARHLASHPDVRAVLVGTRRTDPHGATLGDFQATDAGWPSFMRVNPLLEWRYAEIWAFLRFLGIEYCELYDEGYTSLGGTNDTRPNPALAFRDEDGREKFKPAWELVGEEAERLGRG